MQANLPMAGYLINNLGNAVVATDALPKGQADAAYLPLTANAVANSNLAQAPQNSVKGTYSAAATSTSAVTISIASPGVITWAGHGLAAGIPVTFKTTGALPTGLSPNIEYYIIPAGLGANSFQVSTTVGGTAVNTSGSQSGAHTGYSYIMAGEQDLSYSYLGQQLTSFVSETPMVLGLVAANNVATPDTKIDVSALYAILSSFSGGNGIHTNVAVTINATVVGVNGIDAGALAASTWYNLWLISTGTTISGLISLSATAPTLPAGYFYSTRVGAVRTDSSSKFYRTIQKGRTTQYVAAQTTNTTTYPLLISGASGNVSANYSMTAVNVTGTNGYAPPTAIAAKMQLSNFSAGSMAGPNNNFGVIGASAGPPQGPPIVANSALVNQMFEFVLESANVYYASNGANYLWLIGWTDSVACA